MPWLFCYGSNNPRQLSERLERSGIELRPGRLEDYWRVFRGLSRRWGGGVASIERKAGYSVYGYLAKVSAEDLRRMDEYEGVASGNYARQSVNVESDGEILSAVAYVSRSREFNAPTRPYLEAVAKTISVFWHGQDGGPVKWSEIPIR